VIGVESSQEILVRLAAAECWTMSRPGVTRKMSCTLAMGRKLKARSCTAREEAALVGREANTSVVCSGDDSSTTWSGGVGKDGATTGASGAAGDRTSAASGGDNPPSARSSARSPRDAEASVSSKKSRPAENQRGMGIG